MGQCLAGRRLVRGSLFWSSGGRGLLGAEVVRQAVAAEHATAATSASRPTSEADHTGVRWHALDLRDSARIEALVAEAAPCVIVNATGAKADRSVAVEGPVRLAAIAARHGCRLVHVSSDAVFSGARVHYDEACFPDPFTPYGAAEAEAEPVSAACSLTPSSPALR